MNNDLASLMATSPNAHEPLRFLAADFFVPYWTHFLPQGTELDLAAVRTVQSAARAGVDLSMNGEEIYWNIDFSEASARRAWEAFEERISGLSAETREALRSLCQEFVPPRDEAVEAAALLGFAVRVVRDWGYRGSMGVSAEDAGALDAAQGGPRSEFVQVSDVTRRWLASDTEWDRKLRAQTPDAAHAVATSFGMAYRARAALPLLRKNLLAHLQSDSAYRSFVRRLQRAFERAMSADGIEVKFPAALLA